MLCGCAAHWTPAQRGESDYNWTGTSTNLLGTEQSFEVDNRYGLSWWQRLPSVQADGRYRMVLFKTTGSLALVIDVPLVDDDVLEYSARTDEGSLRAWLYRGYGFDRTNELLGLATVRGDDLDADPRAVVLEGTCDVRVRYSSHKARGAPQELTLRLKSAQPMPLFSAGFERHAEPPEWLEERSKRPDTMHATIEGVLTLSYLGSRSVE